MFIPIGDDNSDRRIRPYINKLWVFVSTVKTECFLAPFLPTD
jgi:hypothetical protein